MGWWSPIEHFFVAIFGKSADAAQKVLHNASSFIQLAEPIVEEIDTDVKAQAIANPSATMAAVSKFLTKYEPNVVRVESTVAAFATLPAADLWRNVALFALQAVAPKGTASSLLNLSIELAYNVFKSKSASQTAAPAA